MKIDNIKRTKKEIGDFYYEGLSLKNEDNSFFDMAPLITTNLGYFPITGVYRTKNESAVRVKTKDYFLDTIFDDHTFLCSNSEKPVWKNIKNLSVGDSVITESGEQKIISIDPVQTNKNFFDFRVDPTHSYFTNGILSHNSMISLSMMREPSIDLIVYIDSEGGGVTKDFAKFLGIDPKKILYSVVDTVEDLIAKMRLIIDVIEKNKTKKNILMIVDSISMLSTDKEKDPKAGCYSPETLIEVISSDKKLKKYIKDVEVGDKVLSHKGTWDEVEKVWEFNKEDKPELIEINTEEGDIINLTPEHKLLVLRENHERAEWIQAQHLTLNDKLIKIKVDENNYNKPIKIKSIKRKKNNGFVYDLTVKDSGTYCTGDYIIGHNSDMGNRAKTTRSFFRQYIRKMQTLNICAVFTAHLTENIGGYGPPKVVSGGTILGYAPSVEVRYSQVNKDGESEQSARGAQMIKIRAEIMKSRLGTAKKRVKFDLDMERGLDAYAGLFDILNDYQFVIPALANVEEQIEEKKTPKKSTGWWMFVPWEQCTESMFNKLVEVGALKLESRKFREGKIKDWAETYDWFIPEMQKILDSIYDMTTKSRNVEEEDENEPELIVEEEKPKKKSKKIEITEVS